MRLIIGGAYQGKRAYAAEKYGAENLIDRFHLLVRDWLESGKPPLEMAEKLLHESPKAVIVMDEIGGGIIPIERSERLWREQVGKVGCFLAERAESVERIVCGIAVRLK